MHTYTPRERTVRFVYSFKVASGLCSERPQGEATARDREARLYTRHITFLPPLPHFFLLFSSQAHVRFRTFRAAPTLH